MTTFNQLMENGKVFGSVVDNVMKVSTYKPIWKNFFDWEYSPTLTFQSYLATAGAAAAGTIIAWSAGKPIRQRPTIGQLTGQIGQIGDAFQMDIQTERKILELEERIARKEANVEALYNFIFNDVEQLVIAPQKRLDILTLGGMSTGKVTVNLDNNPNGIQFEIDLKIPEYKTKGNPWAIGTTTSTPLTDIRNVMDQMWAKGYKPTLMMMSRNTFNKMIASAEFKSVFALKFDNLEVSTVNVVTPTMVNTYLSAVGLPTIQIMEDVVALSNGSLVYPFADDNVVFSLGTKIGQMNYTYANEQRNPRPTKVYATYDNTLLSTYVTKDGRYSEYELNAFPSFNNYQRMARLTSGVKE